MPRSRPARRPRTPAAGAAAQSDAPPTGGPGGADDKYAMWTSGITESYWVASSPPTLTRSLRGAEKADVAVVGAGIAGLTTAYRLMAEGKDVVVLEDGALGSGETGRTTAHFTNALDDRYHVIEAKHGAAGARLAAQSHSAAIEAVADLVKAERIRCGLERVDGYLFLHPTDKPASLGRERDACRRAGLDVEVVDSAPGFATGPAIRFPHQLQLHPLQYVKGLAKAIERGGGRIYTRSHARGIKERSLEANGHKVQAGRIVVATNSPVTTRFAIHSKQYAIRTYVIAARVRRGSVPTALWWDTGDQASKLSCPPYHYLRIHPDEDGDVLIVGGEDHRTGDTPARDPFAALEAWARERFPKMKAVEHRWSGQCFEPIDHLAFIGRDPTDTGHYLATGDSGNGMTHGTIAGLLNADLIVGKSNPWEDLYDPGRKLGRSPIAYAKESLLTGGKYADFLKVGDVPSAEHLKPGQGGVLHALKPKAVYRDEQGELHACSAICPHMGGVVRWNDVEKSFDCPCHGSRFTAYGKVLSGPSNADLDPADVEEEEEKARKRSPRRIRAKVPR